MSRRHTTGMALVAGFLGGLLGSALVGPGHAADSVYRAQRFELIRPDGQVAAVLGFESDAPVLRMMTAKGVAVKLEAQPFNGGNLTLSNAVTSSRIVLGNAVLAQSKEHPVISDSWIEIDGRSNTSVWRAP